jgi:hypothetical protein
MVYNPNTQLYVLFWNNWRYNESGGLYAGDQAATAPHPAGPWTLRTTNPLNTTHPTGDFDVFVDDDGTGYKLYDGNNHLLFIEQLSPDYLSSTGRMPYIPGGIIPSAAPPGRPPSDYHAAFPVEFVEAPAMFKRKNDAGSDVYYALAGHCCCFCYQGSGMFVFWSRHPMGPWTQQSQDASRGLIDLGCTPNATTPTPLTNPMGRTLPTTAQTTSGQGCLYNAAGASVTQAQQNFVIEIPSRMPGGSSEFIWTGDRSMQSPDGIKGHEPQYWGRLQFSSTGAISHQVYEENVTFTM